VLVETTSSNGDTRHKAVQSTAPDHINHDVTGPSVCTGRPAGCNGPSDGLDGERSGCVSVDGVRHGDQWLSLRVRGGARSWPKFTSCFNSRS